jgi:hypothetical protein
LSLIDENGDYLEEYPENVDTQGQRLSLHIDHFSRYAIGTR